MVLAIKTKKNMFVFQSETVNLWSHTTDGVGMHSTLFHNKIFLFVLIVLALN